MNVVGSAVSVAPERLLEIIRIQAEVVQHGLDSSAVMTFVAERACALVHADGAAIELAEGDEMVCRAAYGIAPQQLGSRAARRASFSGLCVELGTPLVCEDAETDTRVEREACRAVGLRSMLVTPLREGDQVVGVLKVMWLQLTRIAAEDAQTLGLLADLVAAAISKEAAATADEVFTIAMDNAGIGMCITGRDGRFLAVNPALCAMLGRDEAALLAGSWQDLTHPDDVLADQEQLQDLLADRIQTYRHRKRYLRPDGEIVWADLSVSCVRGPDRSVRFFVSQMVDMTRQVEAEARLKLLLNNSADAVFQADTAGVIEWLSPSASEVLGWDVDEVIGRTFRELVHPDDLALLTVEPAPAQEAQPRRFELRLRRKDGAYRWLGVVARAIVNEAGQVVGQCGGLRDVTSERELRERLANVVESAQAGTWEWNVQTGETVFNERWAEIIGYTLEELAPVSIQTWIDHTRPDDLAESGRRLEEHWSGRAAVYICEVRMLHKSGREVWVRDIGRVASWTADGKPLVMYGIHLDITAEAESRALLERTQAELRALADSVPDVVFLIDRDYRLVVANQFWRRAVEASGRRVPDSGESLLTTDYPPELLAHWHTCYDRAFAGETFAEEFSTPYPGFARRVSVSHFAPVRDAAGKVTAVAVTSRDVTVEREATAALAAAEARYRLIAENAADLVLRLRAADLTILWASPSSNSLLGWGPEELVGRTMPELIFADDRDAFRVAAARTIVSNTEEWQTSRFVRADGTPLWIEARSRPTIGPDGVPERVASLRVVQREVEARQAEAALTARLQSTLDSMLDPHVLLQAIRNENGAIVDLVYADANQAACEYLNMPREVLVGARALEVLPGTVGAGLLGLCAQTLDTGTPLVLDDTVYGRESTGAERRLDIRGVKVGDALSFTWRDVTERHAATEALRDRVAELDTLQQLAQLLAERVDLNAALEGARRVIAGLFHACSADFHMLPDGLEIAGEALCAGNGVCVLLDEEADEALAEAVRSGVPAAAVGGKDECRLLALPLVSHGQQLGALTITRGEHGAEFSAEERTLAVAIADLLGAVLRTEQIHHAETLQAATLERQRLARDLHDAVSQNIYSAKLIADALPAALEQHPDEARDDIEVLRRVIRAALGEMRTLLYELRPEALTTAPLPVLVERLGDALVGSGSIEVMTSVDPDLALPPDAHVTFYRVAQEALNNVGKYARATHASAIIHRDGDIVRLTVHDDGTGFDPDTTAPGLGTGIMRERAESIGATLTIDSAPGSGTTVTLVWRPCEQ